METEDELPPMSECMKQPMICKHVSYAHQIVDMLMIAMEASDEEPTPEACLLQETLYTVISIIEFDDGLSDLNSILRMHYPHYFNGTTLTEMSITTSN